MSDQTSIFGNEQNTPTQANNQGGSNTPNVQTGNDFADLLTSIKNERGEQKYKTVEDALKGLQNAQEFIPSLRTELTAKDQEIERLRKEAEKAAELERTVLELTRQQQQTQATPQNVPTVEQIAELVNKTLSQKEQEAKAKANVQSVTSTLLSVFGTDAEKKLYETGAELGMSVAEMNNLAATKPQAVFKLLGVDPTKAQKQNSAPVVTTGNSNTSGFSANPQSFIGKNPKTALIGATTQDLQEASMRAKKMVEELHNQGKSVHDLTDPKVFFKHFK